jgi:hypothetical protein
MMMRAGLSNQGYRRRILMSMAAFINMPQLTEGSVIPRLRKLNPASPRMMPGTLKVMFRIKMCLIWEMMWRRRMVTFEAPAMTLAMTKSAFFRERTQFRIPRALPAQLGMARMAVI